MTAILVECGFMTNAEEATLLKSSDYRLKCAYAIVEGLVEQYSLKEKPKPQESPKKGLYKVQCGAFSDEKNAENLKAKLIAAGFKDAFIKFE